MRCKANWARFYFIGIRQQFGECHLTSLSGFTIFWALHELRLHIKEGNGEFVGNLAQSTFSQNTDLGLFVNFEI